MKKIILQSLVCICCIAFITGCSKNVKAPAKKTTNTTINTTASLQTQNQNQTQTTSQQGHTCGGGSSSSNDHSGGSY